MTAMPNSLRDSIPQSLIADADNWWCGLSDNDRDELVRLCDSRREMFLFETFDPSNDNPKITGGKFLPHDDGFGIQEWGEDYFDTLMSNPELMIVYDPQVRTFHIGCSRHSVARDCFLHGTISNDFRCPFADGDCLMDQIRQNRSAVGLRLIGTRNDGNEPPHALERQIGAT